MSEVCPIRLLIADDHYVVRMGLAAVMKYDPDLNVVAEAADGAGAVAQFLAHRPDVTLMDVRMPGMDGIEATLRILAADPDARVLMLSTVGREHDVHQAMAAGAKGYLLKTAGLDDLQAAVRAVVAGGTWLSGGLPKPDRRDDPTIELSPRQREVLELLGRGFSNKEIAKLLGFTVNSTKYHLNAIFQKLGARDRTEAVVEAIRLGFLREPQ